MMTQMPQPRWPFPQKRLEPPSYQPQPRLPFANTFSWKASLKKQATFWHELALLEGEPKNALVVDNQGHIKWGTHKGMLKTYQGAIELGEGFSVA